MFRRSLVQGLGGYNERLVRLEDYDLWLRVLSVASIDNLPDAQIKYRTHAGQHSHGSTLSEDFRSLRESRVRAAQAIGVTRWSANCRHAVWVAAQLRREARFRLRGHI
jgi:hypothetical protein